jgi:hypothetical protein
MSMLLHPLVERAIAEIVDVAALEGGLGQDLGW